MSVEPKAEHFLRMAAEEMADRAKVRDAPQGERSMDRTVRAFWALYGDGILARGYMTETEGWQFMSLLKKARGAQGEFRADDHVDDVAYAALAGESAVRVSSSVTRSQLSAREWGTQEPSEQILRESYGGTD